LHVSGYQVGVSLKLTGWTMQVPFNATVGVAQAGANALLGVPVGTNRRPQWMCTISRGWISRCLWGGAAICAA
jgi:hypothetical protein